MHFKISGKINNFATKIFNLRINPILNIKTTFVQISPPTLRLRCRLRLLYTLSPVLLLNIAPPAGEGVSVTPVVCDASITHDGTIPSNQREHKYTKM